MATIEELVEKHTRRELEKMAYELGIDTTDLREYPNKTKIAGVILRARGEEVPEEVEKVAEEKPPKPRIGKKGVLAKQAAMDMMAKEIEKSVKRIHTEIRGMVKKNKDAAAKIDAGAKEIQRDIEEQGKENAAAIANINAGAKEVQRSIEVQAKENEDYIKDFYYG